jgi:multimeric flavodoxin WrbA
VWEEINVEDKNIVVILGSPRKNGNSEILANEVISGTKAKGAKIKTFRLQDMHINPCDGCGACQRREAIGCIVKDDMQTIYPNLKAADIIVIASPIYWFSVSAQVKAFIDRFYSLQGVPGNVLSGKKAAIILTYADANPDISGAANAIKMFNDIFSFLHGEIVGVIHGSAWQAGAIRSNERLLKEAYELGGRLASQIWRDTLKC